MNRVIKYFLIIINIYCVCALIFYIKLWYKNTLISENIKITYNNIVNDSDEYLVNVLYINPRTNLFCSIDNKNWVNIENCKFYLKKGKYNFFIRNNFNVISKKYEVVEKFEGKISSNIDMLDVYYLALGGKKKIELKFDYPENYNINYKWFVEKNNIVKVEDDVIYGLSVGETNIIVKLNDGNKKSFKIVVTDLITPPQINENKRTLTCNRYSEEENLILDKILESRVKESGSGTRGGVIAAARFLTLEFPYNISYFAENGRINNHGLHRTIDGEGRFYHKGLYLSSVKYKDLMQNASTLTGPKPWGCPLYSNPMGINQANGLDCSGFVTWAMYNGGFDVGDVGAGDFVELNDELSDLGVHKKITFDYMKNGNYKVGDYIAKNGHAALIIGIDDKNIYTAESLGKGLRAKTYERYSDIVYSPILDYVIEMDDIYPNGEGIYTVMWN